MAGLSSRLSGDEVQGRLGELASALNQALENVQHGVNFLAANDDARLLALYGISGGDAALLRSAFVDMNQLRAVYEGETTVLAEKNFRTFIGQIYGLGF